MQNLIFTIFKSIISDKMNRLLSYLLTSSFILLASSFIFHTSSLLYSYPPGWSDDIMINQDTTIDKKRPDIDVDSQNNVWTSWDDATWSVGEIYYSKRDSLGNCIIPETNVSNNASKSWMARIANDHSDNVQFIWRDQTPQGIGIWHAKLANDGAVIVPSHLAASGGGGFTSSLLPEMVLDKYQNINIAWDEIWGSDERMVYTKLDTLGNIIIEKLVVTLPGHDAYAVGIDIDSFANCHLACRTDTSGANYKLTYSKIDKDGNIIISNKILGDGGLPTIIADRNQNIHMVYGNPIGPGSRIEYLKLNQNGELLTRPKTISTPEIQNNSYPHMAIDSLQCLHVVWEGDVTIACNVMYCKLDTMGDFIVPPMKIVYQPLTYSGQPRIAVDPSNRLHVTWVDGRSQIHADIYYKRGENESGVEQTTQSKPTNLSKISVSPNPFSKLTNISFGRVQGAKGMEQRVELRIYDSSGRLVKDFSYAMHYAPRPTHISWQGDDDLGNRLPAGVYFLQVSTSIFTQTLPIVLLK